MPREVVSSLLESALKLGVGAVIGVFAVFKITGSFDTELKAARADLVQVREQLMSHNSAMEREAAINRALLRGICYGTSSDIPQARALCEIQDISK